MCGDGVMVDTWKCMEMSGEVPSTCYSFMCVNVLYL